jgi:hypothetical protein
MIEVIFFEKNKEIFYLIYVIFVAKNKEIFCLIYEIFVAKNKEIFCLIDVIFVERNKEIFSLIDGAEQGNISYINFSIYYSFLSIERLIENIFLNRTRLISY